MYVLDLDVYMDVLYCVCNLCRFLILVVLVILFSAIFYSRG
jgi:hypothetical protein